MRTPRFSLWDYVDEAWLAVGLGLLTAGLWAWIGPPALAAPGGVMVWLALPTRKPFIERSRKGDA